MKEQALAHLFYKELLKIQQDDSIDNRGKIEGLYRLLNLLFIESTQKERLQFTTLFARIAFACQKNQVNKQTQFYIYAFRKEAVKHLQSKTATSNVAAEQKAYHLGLKVVAETIVALFHTPMTAEVLQIVPKRLAYSFSPVKISEFKRKTRVVALSDDFEKEQLIARDEANPTEDIRIQYNIADRNENFRPTIEAIRHTFGFPVNLNLIDTEVDTDGIYRPKAIVIEPDYLVDVSAVSECFKEFGAEPLMYLQKKFLPFQTSVPLMIGNIANYLLDELMNNPDATFKETFPKVFQLNPLSFSLMDNREILSIMQKCQKHFIVLKQMVHQEFQRFQIEPKDCFLEPSFYSETYGLQGRLDIFYKKPNPEEKEGKKLEKAAIVELKSGKAYMPNRHGISQNHYTQTLLYDLIVRSVFDNTIDPANYILYSGQDIDQLRYAPVTKSQQFEAIQIRNQLVALERQIANISFSAVAKETQKIKPELEGSRLFRKLSPMRFPRIKGFVARDLALFEKVFSGMTALERKYFLAFSGFIAREHQLAKTGVQGLQNVNGLAALWLSSFEEKDSNFDILSQLTIVENKSQEDEAIIIFNKTEKTNPLANFRNGDIAVLYPSKTAEIFDDFDDTDLSSTSTDQAVLSNQIFKCTIIHIGKTQVKIRLRYRQFNASIFEQHEFWNLEHDMLDMSFTAMYRALFAFAQFPKHKKELLLTQRPPVRTRPLAIQAPQELTEEQQDIFKKVIAAQDYFLLWGPPGTGKTSMMLKHIVGYLLNHSDENLMLLAYTNRAVDEICQAIEDLKTFIKEGKATDIKSTYLRIGSRYSTGRAFQRQLLSAKTEKVKNRQGLLEIIANHRIFVGTVASVANKPELMQLKKFERVIIDEASQILEPNLIGFLPHFNRFVLIGDHKQLPAVVVQDTDSSEIEDADLQSIGLNDLRNSFFERLYKRCIKNDWDWAYAQLSHQGRMHRDIMDFPNRYFYKSSLNILPDNISFHLKQIAPIALQANGNTSDLEQQVLTKRMLFIPTEADFNSTTRKTNRYEAEQIAALVQAFQNIYAHNDKKLTKKSIGIITPYRAQIAQIQEVLQQQDDINLDLLTIDTVERYQGGARDIILISLCTNSASQLESLVSLSEEGVDRKLNVALTRAREHLVILGNADLLRGNDIYEALMGFCA